MSSGSGVFFTPMCRFCGKLTVAYPDEEEARRGAVWHVYEEHREEWILVVGEDRPPRDEPPRAYPREH